MLFPSHVATTAGTAASNTEPSKKKDFQTFGPHLLSLLPAHLVSSPYPSLEHPARCCCSERDTGGIFLPILQLSWEQKSPLSAASPAAFVRKKI